MDTIAVLTRLRIGTTRTNINPKGSRGFFLATVKLVPAVGPASARLGHYCILTYLGLGRHEGTRQSGVEGPHTKEAICGPLVERHLLSHRGRRQNGMQLVRSEGALWGHFPRISLSKC
jgi:hypothetical protein